MKPIAFRKRGRRYWRNLAVFSLFAVFAGCVLFQYVAHPFLLAYGWAHPHRSAVCCVTPADRGLDYENVSLTTRDGLTLRGWYIPSQNGAAVILIHSMASSRVGVLDAAVVLAHRGYGVLMFDLRAHGESDGDVLPFGGNEAEDAIGAASYLVTRADVDPNRIGAMGFSLGAQVAILGAARDERIKAVIADGPGGTTASDMAPPRTLGDWLYVPYDLIFFPILNGYTGVSNPMSLRDALSRITPRPILLIGGGSEQHGLDHLYVAAREPKTLWIIPEAGHIQGLSVRPEEYEAKIVQFFDRALLENGP